jgi:hypothetical protein
VAAAVLAPLFPVAGQSPGGAPAPAPSLQLRTYPTQVYFTSANAKERLSGTALVLIVEDAIGQTSTPQSLELNYKRGDAIIKSESLLPPMLEAVDIPNLPTSRLHSPEAAKTVQWPHAYRLVLSVPEKANVDSIEARLALRHNGAPRTISTVIPVRAYDQKTALVFPFRGEGMISQAGVLASGHRNRSGLYAVDALGLSKAYGPMVRAGGDENPANYAGWGRAIIAPAAGTIVVARNDRPDQTTAGNSDPAFFLPKYADGGDPGNHVVIDHGNGEFSMIAHLQRGSVKVKAGDRVTQGQMLGLMGNSGDTSGPHVHYQLQSGADWERSDALPFTFTNVGSITRGSYFDAK